MGLNAEVVQLPGGDLALRFLNLSDEQKTELHLLISTGMMQLNGGMGSSTELK